MPPLEAWEKVFIDGDVFAGDIHAFIECTACHGGQSIDDLELAHEGLITDPAAEPAAACALCHVEIGETAANPQDQIRFEENLIAVWGVTGGSYLPGIERVVGGNTALTHQRGNHRDR